MLRVVDNFVRFSIDGLDINSYEPKVFDLQFTKVCGSNRTRADSWSKIVFQYMARSSSPLTIDVIVNAINCPSTITDNTSASYISS